MQFNYDAYKAGFQMPTKKTQEQELMEKMKLLNYQSQLKDSEMSDLEKQYNLMRNDPAGFSEFMGLKNMITPYQQGMLAIQRGQLGIQGAKLNGEKMPSQQKLFDFLKSKYPNMPDNEILARINLEYKPPALSQEEQLKALMGALQ